MTTVSRVTKQIFVALIFLIIIGGLGFFGYRGANPPKPTPTPNPTANIKIVIAYEKLINVKNNDYDFVAKVTNPSSVYGSGDVEYDLNFYDSTGAVVSTKSGSFYILPGETKYVVETPLRFSQLISSAHLQIKSVDWQKLNSATDQSILFLDRNVGFSLVNQPGVFGKVSGSITNSSNYDFAKADVNIILFDQENNIIAVSRTDIRSFLAKTNRGFEVAWPDAFNGQVGQAFAKTSTNVFQDSNFLRDYGGQERFQEFY